MIEIIFVGGLLALALSGQGNGQSGQGNGQGGQGNGQGAGESRHPVIQAAYQLINEGYLAKHCWDWIDQVFLRAGYPLARRRTIFKGSQYGGDTFSLSDPSVLEPGDWLYIHNQNRYDKNGNHSVFFLGWIDPGALEAQTASATFSGQPGKIETRNLQQTPVTWITRAV